MQPLFRRSNWQKQSTHRCVIILSGNRLVHGLRQLLRRLRRVLRRQVWQTLRRYLIGTRGASWVGPMAERMDWIRDCGPSEAIRTQLSLRPSEYLRRNVRVTPFITEDIGLMVERYGLGEVYVFSTDFPAPEGGRDPLDKMASSVSRHGPEAVERLLITNAEWLLPTPP